MDLLKLMVRVLNVMSRVSTMKVHVNTLELTLSCCNARVWELESQISSKNSEFDAAATELELMERRLCLAQDVITHMGEYGQNKGPSCAM